MKREERQSVSRWVLKKRAWDATAHNRIICTSTLQATVVLNIKAKPFFWRMLMRVISPYSQNLVPLEPFLAYIWRLRGRRLASNNKRRRVTVTRLPGTQRHIPPKKWITHGSKAALSLHARFSIKLEKFKANNEKLKTLWMLVLYSLRSN